MPSSELPSYCGMVGRSETMQALHRQIERVARTDATVLIRGERGTGKELVANALQQLSRRSGAAYVKINCATFPCELLASELLRIKRRAGKLIWLNPLLGSPHYQPLCQGIKTVLPYCDYFLPVHNLESLKQLATAFARPHATRGMTRTSGFDRARRAA